jgi:ribosomal protein L11 methyltransferase
MASSDFYFQISVTGLSRDREDEFTSLCFDHGAAGVAENLSFVQRDLRYDPDLVETKSFDMNVFFTAELAAMADAEILFSKLQTLRVELESQFQPARVQLSREQNRDWLEEWKKGFKPFLFAHPFWVVPAWLPVPEEIASQPGHVIWVEPGMAFGTGTHETTRLAAALLIEEMLQAGQPHGRSLLDVGTGTGILALVAQRLGAGHVVGLDNDPEARRTARENLERNRETRVTIKDNDLADETSQYDIVVANIIDGVLMMLHADLARALKPGGRMILSGVLVDREEEFYREFQAKTGLTLLRKTRVNEWTAAVLEKVAR